MYGIVLDRCTELSNNLAIDVDLLLSFSLKYEKEFSELDIWGVFTSFMTSDTCMTENGMRAT